MMALLIYLSIAISGISPDVSKEDLKKLVAAGVSDDVIVAFIRSHRPVVALSAEDLVELRRANVSESVLAAMAEGTAARPASPTESEAVQPSAADSYPWYYPQGYYYDYYYGPWVWWYLGPGYYRYPYRYWGFPYGYRYPHYHPYPWGHVWGPYGHYPDHIVNPHGGEPHWPAVPHSTPKGGGKH